MNYVTEDIAATLKAARERKELSQRELSKRAGVPQSHISKIESGGVDLRISSLADIARALDLEIALVPRKALPALKSITRSTSEKPTTSAQTRKEFTNIKKLLDNLSQVNIAPGELDLLLRRFRELQHAQPMLSDTDALRNIRKTLEAFKKSDGQRSIEEATKQMAALRNRIAHSIDEERGTDSARPAYRLDGGDDG